MFGMTMTPIEQGKLFKLTRKRCPGWSQKKHSGYVHGAVDGSRRSEPRRQYIHGFRKEKDYDVGYIYGFIDAYGEDAFHAEWAMELCLSQKSLAYRWWDNE